MWMEIFSREKKFDNYVTTRPHGIGKASGFLTLLLLPLGIINCLFFIPSLLLFFIYFFLNRKFFFLTLREKGLCFFILTIIYDLIFSIAVTLGAGTAFLKYRVFCK
jgi:hypothetical protein